MRRALLTIEEREPLRCEGVVIMMKKLICPSMMCANFDCLKAEVEAAEGRITEIIERSNRAHKGFNTLRDRATVTGGPDQPAKENGTKK